MTLDQMLTEIIRREGDYVDHATDRGGPTKHGITQATLSAYMGRAVSKEEVRDLPEAMARQIYTKRYWLDPGFDRIPGEELQAVMLDAAVNHGPRKAVQLLQRALGVPDDGVLGPVTLAAIPYLDSRKVALKLLAHRIRLFGRIITDNPSQAVFAAGWLNRAADLMEEVA